MEAKYAVIIVDEFMSGAFAGLEVREAWHTLKTHCTQPASAQQLKPKMPSFADVTKDVQFMTVDEGNKAFVVYSNIARHFDDPMDFSGNINNFSTRGA